MNKHNKKQKRIEAIETAVIALSIDKKIAIKINNRFNNRPDLDDIWTTMNPHELLYKLDFYNPKKLDYVIKLAQNIATDHIHVYFSKDFIGGSNNG